MLSGDSYVEQIVLRSLNRLSQFVGDDVRAGKDDDDHWRSGSKAARLVDAGKGRLREALSYSRVIHNDKPPRLHVLCGRGKPGSFETDFDLFPFDRAVEEFPDASTLEDYF